MPKGRDMEAEEQHQLDFAEREVVLRANLDDVDADRCVWASMRFLVNGPRHPRVGELVFLIDGARGGSIGSVVELNGWMARVRLLPEQSQV
jgi:kynureninase